MKLGIARENETEFSRNHSNGASQSSVLESLSQSLKQHFEVQPKLKNSNVSQHDSWTFGISAIDACLPECGLSRSGLHEVEPLSPTDMPSLTGFAFGLLSRLRSNQPIIWCVTAQQIGDYGQLYAFGFERYGISPAQIIITKVQHPLHLHFALEEALKTDGVAAVIGEGPRPTFTGSRRLSLLAQKHGRPCLLLNSQADGMPGSAALTRWQIEPTQGVEDPLDPFGPGLPTWRIALPRARGGRAMPHLRNTRREPDADKISKNFDVAEKEHVNTTVRDAHNHTPYPWRVTWDEQTLSFREASIFSSGAISENSDSVAESHSRLVGRRGS